MEELQPQEIEDLLRELEEEDGAGEVPAPEVETEVRICPRCGKHNLENAWHCIDCGTTLSVKTLMEEEDGQPSMASIAGQRALSNLSAHFEQDVAELLDTALQDDESVVWGGHITQLSRTPPFRFGYLLVTSRQLICVEFESEPVVVDVKDTGVVRGPTKHGNVTVADVIERGNQFPCSRVIDAN